MLKSRIPKPATKSRIGKPAKARVPKWLVSTVVGAGKLFRQAPWPEQRRRYKQFLATVFKAGHTGRIEISDYEDAFLQSFAEKLDMPSTAGRIGKPGLVSQDERLALRALYKRLEFLGVKLPDIGF